MRKSIVAILGLICIILIYFTSLSAGKVFRSEVKLPPRTPVSDQPEYRLVLITQELETPFWNKVSQGAQEEAEKDGASIEVWGSYDKNEEDFLKKIEIAIDSKVDGIIVQGLDSDEFKNLTKIKAAFNGIPIITVANDVPMVDSLRRTYVGSNQYLAGQMIANQLLTDMGDSGKVILMGDSRNEYYQQQRLKGIDDILKNHPNIYTKYAETEDTKEQVIATTQNAMNELPTVDAFIAVNANLAGAMVQEIGRRARVGPYFIYSFDDSQDAMSLLESGNLDGMIEQSPEDMGRISVDRMIQWLGGTTVPLNTEGYLTDIRMLKRAERP
ncbi:ribose transport system substrate-binding protein [Paenibacillus cellulosilyticus]|uniref:Ribose transport system substrate-binding protein n=1 Tax=Paenibacillus cellulosilyticus TaxID=375489 RepID=A0A2V2YRG0_9BACL|nr:substrate-binding domain-containing protein [Paenibacillus cellulosilyticus]PWV99769.1 ribose transport system substrate-binding protein [Paenibacillus cellulosilyticus]QKS44810.1 substrate-binding domain-containing protein [Paenibacillus cellulosilyticus]